MDNDAMPFLVASHSDGGRINAWLPIESQRTGRRGPQGVGQAAKTATGIQAGTGQDAAGKP